MKHEPIGYMFKQITDKLKGSVDASLKKKGFTFSQVRVLEYLSSRGNKTTQKSVEEFLGVSHPTVVGIISRMERNGYLVCYVDKEDRRNKIVELTERAAGMTHEMVHDIDAQEKKLLKGLTQDEVDHLYRMLCVILDNIE